MQRIRFFWSECNYRVLSSHKITPYPHPQGVRLWSNGFSHDLSNSPPDCCLSLLRLGRSFESHTTIKIVGTAQAIPTILVRVAGFEPTASCSQTQKHRFFASFCVLFRAFSSETRAFSCHKVHNSHVVQTCKWSRLWSDLKLHITRPTSHKPRAPPEVDFLLLPL